MLIPTDDGIRVYRTDDETMVYVAIPGEDGTYYDVVHFAVDGNRITARPCGITVNRDEFDWSTQ